MNEISERLSQAILFLRKSGAIKNSSDVARNMGVSRSTLSMLTHGYRTPNAEHLLKLCDSYPISFSWLRTGKGGMVVHDRTAELLAQIEKLNARIAELEAQKYPGTTHPLP